MAFIYEVNGQRVEFEKEPTERDIDEAAKSLRPAPKSQQQAPVEGAGGAAFGVYRPQGRRPESQQDREASKEMPIQTARGLVTGSLGAPSDLLNLPGNLYGMATGQPSPYTVPLGSESWNEMLPGKSDTPQAKLARFGGEAMAPFPTVKGLQTIPKAVGAVGDVVSGAVGTGTGYIARPGRTPRGYQVPSQRNPIGSTFTPPEEFAKFERGELPYGQMPETRPISELPQGKLDQAAMMLSGGNIPNAGQGARAFGERLGETYRNPITAAADIGSMFFTGGVPVLSALRGGLAGAQALADMRLANKGFTPELPKILNEYQTGVRPLPGVQPGPMPRDFMAAGAVNPAGMNTPAAQAAMATTQAKAATTRAPAQPKVEWTLPDVGTHYNQAAQGSTNFGDTFNRAVSARTADLLKDARKNGQNLTPQMAEDLAWDQIKEWRSQNVEGWKPKQEPAGPTLAQEGEPPTLVKTLNEGTLDKPNVEWDRTDWFKLQEKVRSGKPLTSGDQSLADKITNRYGPDPFGSGDLTGKKMFNTKAVGEPQAAIEPTPTAEMPVIETTPEVPIVETKKRDMSVGNAKKQFYKDLENDNIPVAEAVKKYEIVTTKKQMRVYNDAYDAAIAEGKTEAQATQAAKQALQRNGLPYLSGDRAQARMKQKDSFKIETDLANDWYKGLDKASKEDVDRVMDVSGKSLHQTYIDLSAEHFKNQVGKSFFEEPLEQTPTGKYNTMPETTPTPKIETPKVKTLQSWDDYQAGNKTNPETGKYMGPEEMIWRDTMRADEIGSTIENRQVGVEGKGKKAKPIMEEVKITSYDPASWENNIQPDIEWTSMVKENKNIPGQERYPVFTLKGTKDGVDYTLKLNKQSAHMGDLYADIDGKPTLVKQWYSDYSERAPVQWDKVQAKHKLDLYKEENPPWEPRHTDARGYKPDVEDEIDVKTSKPKDVLEMKTGGKVFDNKADYEAQVLLDKLAGKPTTGSFVDNGMRYEITEIDYGNVPKDVLKRMNKPLTEVRVFSEKTGNQISGPAVETPEKSLRERVEDKMRKRK